MNRFAVIWEEEIVSDLTALWLQSSDPNAITAAQAQIDQSLARNPIGHGHHLAEGLYQLDEPPLTVTFEIDQDAMLVTVTSVRLSN